MGKNDPTESTTVGGKLSQRGMGPEVLEMPARYDDEPIFAWPFIDRDCYPFRVKLSVPPADNFQVDLHKMLDDLLAQVKQFGITCEIKAYRVLNCNPVLVDAGVRVIIANSTTPDLTDMVLQPVVISRPLDQWSCH
jgi:hypothetical protein